MAKGSFIEETIIVHDDEGEEIELTFEIHGWADFPRGADYFCAFCKGDPCAEHGEGLISIYRACTESWFETCPVCKGFPS